MKTRFAPSPSGLMHPGNVRTALFNYLFARHKQGQFLLRIEDTDAAASTEEHIQNIVDDLRELGINWERTAGGEKYDRQSRRGAIYAAHYNKLLEQDKAYHCFCSEDSLRLLRKSQLAAGEPPRYNGVCRALTKGEVARRRNAGESAALRLRLPASAKTEFTDIVRGPQTFSTEHLGDFIIRRSDGSPSFMFANAVDDAMTGITLVIRGEDHLTNTPRQILVLKSLGMSAPDYAHISLILGDDGAPLSKRNGSRAIRELLDEGYLPGALVNYLARLGCVYAEQELFSLEDLARRFDPQKLTRSAARFDMHQLAHWQRRALAAMHPAELYAWMQVDRLAKIPAGKETEFARIISPNILLPAEAKDWAESLYGACTPVSAAADREFWSLACRVFDEEQDWRKTTQILAKVSGKRGKSLFIPLRLALSGKENGPALEDLAELLGAELVTKKLEYQVRAAT